MLHKLIFFEGISDSDRKHLPTPDAPQLEAAPVADSAYLSANLARGFGCHQIDDLPLGRKKIHTKASDRGAPAYDLIHHQVIQCRQVYIILPLVEESEKLKPYIG